MTEPAAGPCEHLAGITAADVPAPRTPAGCEECLTTGSTWVSLRECVACGHVGCCDSSPGRHATAHFHKTRHPVMVSLTAGDTWDWCYEHETAGELA